MKKEILHEELFKVLADAKELQEKSELELLTAEFLKSEADKLMAKMTDDTIPFEDKEEISKQMDALHTRMKREVRSFEAGIPKLEILDNRMKELKLIIDAGLVDD